MSAISAFKPLSMADGCLASLPAVLITNKAQCPFRLSARALRLDSVKANLLTLPLKNEKKYGANFVVRTSEWAQAAQVEEEEFVFGQEQAAEARVSDWEGENEAEPEGGNAEESGEEGGFDEEDQELPEDGKLFVGNLPYDVDSEQLAQIFDKAGIVEVAEVIYNRETDQSRGFGFVTMSTVEEAEKAVQLFHRYDINGRLLTVNKASPRGSRTERVPREFEPSFRIYVGNLPWQVDDTRLEQVFSEHGKVVDARVVSDRDTGRSRGFGFVTMSSKDEVDDAIAALDGQILDGRALRVNVAEQRPRRI